MKRTAIPPEAKVYGLSGDDNRNSFRRVGHDGGISVNLLVRGLRLLTKTQWHDVSLIFAFCLIIIFLIVLPAYYFAKVQEKTAILDSRFG